MQRFHRAWVASLALALLIMPAGCGGSASPYVGPPATPGPTGTPSPTGTPGPTATPAPTATPTAPPIVPSIQAISFGSPSPGATPCPSACATTFTVSEAGYTGSFHGASADTTIATIALVNEIQQSRAAQSSRIAQLTVATFQVTAVGSGTTTITISDSNGNSFPLPVTVTSGITLNPQLQQP